MDRKLIIKTPLRGRPVHGIAPNDIPIMGKLAVKQNISRRCLCPQAVHPHCRHTTKARAEKCEVSVISGDMDRVLPIKLKPAFGGLAKADNQQWMEIR